MDVFNSALRNPLPPSRRQYKHSGDSGPVLDEDSANSESTSPNHSTPSAHREVDPKSGSKKKSSRRKHRNSHLGCGICKKRRIKCDENLPQCFNCIKGKLQCAYLKLDAPARNALRMAQYNQNLRDDKQDEPAFAADIAAAKYPTKEHQPEASQIPVLVNNSDLYPTYMSNRVAPMAQPFLPLQEGPGFPGQYSDHSISKQVGSPYGPVVQFQSLGPGMTYAVPVQIVNAPQVMYQGPEQIQYNAPNPPVQALPIRNLATLPPHTASIMAPGMAYGQAPKPSFETTQYPAHSHSSIPGTSISQPQPPREIPPDMKIVSPSTGARGEAAFQDAPQAPSVALPSSIADTPSLLSVASVSKTSASDKEVSSSTSPNTNSELGLRPPQSDAVSNITSPSLQSAASDTSHPSEGGDESPSNVKLAPIRAKNDVKKESEPENIKDAEKVPSIRMLLS